MYDETFSEAGQFVVHWHTKIGAGSTYYEGKITVWGRDRDHAREIAQREVHRNFRDYSRAHIVTTEVEKIAI